MTHWSIKSIDQRFALFFVKSMNKNIGKNINKNISSR